MRKLQDIKGEEAIDVMVDIIEPISKIAKDDKVLEAISSGNYKSIDFVKTVIKKYKKEIITIMAIIDGKSYKDFLESFNVLTLPAMLIDTFNDPQIMALFPSAAETTDVNSSSSAMESTEA